MDKKAIIKALRDTAQSASNSIASNVSGPVDLLAAGLRGVGLPIPQNAFGGSQWMADKGLTREVEMGAPRIIGETLGMAGPAIATAKAPQIAAGMNQMVDNAMAPATLRKEAGAVYINSVLSNNLDDAKQLAAEIEKAGLIPKIDQASGGSVYVTASTPNYTKSGQISKRNPSSPLMTEGGPFKARFADHPTYWGATVSSDPFTGNTAKDIAEVYFQKNPNERLLSSSRFVPGTLQGEAIDYTSVMTPSRSGKSMVRKEIQEKRPFSFIGDDLERK
jgi:hypothetical protein